ncbi:MAG TPA: L-threonine 3-dehydrogenase [Bdellovibrionales bacterium]|nr:L-threonine 3-dehydrogenase [Pseudobdellovibrionaceae bacterium]HAG90404.1 L-threonine 3-dehydrogenase [Bdellovibrionales bacterium]|tara:strand:+ start:4028 stop:5071 length:1044 start_codon:yes stop_codon:yes gene_type:complete
MKAGVWRGPDQLKLEDHVEPKVEPGSVLLKVESCAICGSDLRILKHGNERIQAPRIIGHEISGTVTAVGDGVQNFKAGDHVAVGADIPCGECEHCLNGRGNCCDINLAMGYQFDGGFANYVLLPKVMVDHGPVHKFSKDLDFDRAALAEPLACCLNGYERGLMEPGRTVVVFGAGPIGVMLSLLAGYYKAPKVILIDPSQDRLDLAAKLLEVTPINPLNTDPVKAVMDLTEGQGAGMIFTACSVRETHEQALKMVSKRGVVNLFGGLPKGTEPISLDSNFIHYREAYVTGSHGSTPEQHKKALELIESGQVDVAPLISHRYSLNQLEEAFEMAQSKTGLKVIVKPNE